MRKIAFILALILTMIWLSGCNNRSNPTFKESEMAKVDSQIQNSSNKSIII
ncbi:MAG: hypothetical protein FWC09_01790 [Lachnospiraceae bacterium]|nr:hypothetical protein [Lachnospiraceae bacterium]